MGVGELTEICQALSTLPLFAGPPGGAIRGVGATVEFVSLAFEQKPPSTQLAYPSLIASNLSVPVDLQVAPSVQAETSRSGMALLLKRIYE